MRYIRPEGAIDPNLLMLEHEQALWRLQLLHAATAEHRERSGHVPHVHDIYHIVLHTAGFNEFLLDGQRAASRPGSLVLCPPGVPHDFAPLNPGAVEYDEVSFQLAHGDRTLSLPIADVLSYFVHGRPAELPLTCHVAASPSRRIRQLIALVTSEAGSGSTIALYRAHLAIAELFAVILEEVAAQGPAADRIALAHRNITIRYAQPLSIATLAEELELSPAYLCRAFRRRYGLSPLEFRQELRLGAAARLLQTSSLSCKEIASRLGFADVQTFTKAFARHHGHTPGRFSQALRGK